MVSSAVNIASCSFISEAYLIVAAYSRCSSLSVAK